MRYRATSLAAAVAVVLASGSPAGADDPAQPDRTLHWERGHVCLNYPPEARGTDSPGMIVVAFRVGADGTVIDPVVMTSSGNALLDQAALACISRWHYTPATKDGVPVEKPWQAGVQYIPH